MPCIISVEDPEPIYWDIKPTKNAFIQTWSTSTKGLIVGAVTWKIWFTEMPILFRCNDKELQKPRAKAMKLGKKHFIKTFLENYP